MCKKYLAVLLAYSVLAGATLATTPARATVTVDGVELIERVRVGRTTFNYTYRITATNTAPIIITDAVVYLSLTPPDPASIIAQVLRYDPIFVFGQTSSGTALIDDTVNLGVINGGQTVTSTDTFTIQQDRRFPLASDALIFEVGFTAGVRLDGIVTDTAIPFAGVEVLIDRSESGRPIIESGRPIIERYDTTADAEGRYSVTVDFVAETDFVSITANGVAQFDFVALNSVVGSAGSLLRQATDGPLQVNGEGVNALNITHVSTALAELALRVNGDMAFTNDADLAAAQALVDTQELIINAAVLKTVIDNANIDLPPGINTTQELLDDLDAFNAYLEDLQMNFPDELQSAIDETIIDLSTGYVAEELPATLYLTFARQNPLVSAASVLTFDQDGSATHIDSAGETTDANWQVNAAGEIVVTLNNPPAAESFLIREVPPGSGTQQQVRALISLIERKIVRVAVGIRNDQVLVGRTTSTTFPDHVGVLPDELVVSEPSPDNSRLAFDESGILPITSDELVGERVMISYFHTDNAALGQSNPDFGADFLTFAAGGTGSTARRQFSFTWSTDSAGRLAIIFANGDRNEYVRYTRNNEDIVSLGVLVARYGSGLVSTSDIIAASVVAGTQFNEAMLLNRKYRGAIGFSDASSGLARFDFNFLPGNVGCRDSGGLVDFEWGVSAAGYAETTRSIFGTFGNLRSWQAAAVVSGKIGPRYWLVETVEFGDTTDPDYPSDPTMTPGRINFYEDIKDITGNTAPTPVDDAVSTTTDTPVFIPVLANDTDAEGDAIIVTGAGATTLGGTVVSVLDEFAQIAGFTYTPPAGVSGVTDTFTYTLVDGSCAVSSNPGTVSVTIN